MSTLPKPAVDQMTVLLVCSHAPTRLSLKQFLVGRKLMVEIAGTGREAIKHDRACMSDMIISDEVLPDMPADELITAIRHNRLMMKDIVDNEMVPVLLLTRSQKTEKLALQRLGVIGSLPKPINLKEIGSYIDRVRAGELTPGESDNIDIAVLDPELRAATYLANLVRASDVSVHPVTDVFDLSSLASDVRIDILVVELMGLGDEPIQPLKEFRARTENVRIVVVTAMSDEAINNELKAMKVHSILTKPINPVSFRKLIRELVIECHR